jgi:DNA-directed RNA polymerase specialized sigma24 family protein
VSGLADSDFRTMLAADPRRAWRAFLDQHTPTLLALIERAGIVDRDEAMEIYVLACERLSERNCERLRRRDPGKGSIQAWLSVVIRHIVVDWVRSRAGRRRLFGAIQQLDAFDQRVFELYYWEDRMPAEIAEIVGTRSGTPVGMDGVFEALARIERVLTGRHRADLLALAVRSRAPASLDDEDSPVGDVADDAADPEASAVARQSRDALARALSTLPPEDAAIVRLRFIQGLNRREVQRALRLEHLTEDRLAGILSALRMALAAAGTERSAR